MGDRWLGREPGSDPASGRYRGAYCGHADDSAATLRIWAADPATAEAIQAAGAVPSRHLVQLQCRLPPVERPATAGEARIVAFRPGIDEGAYLIVSNEAFEGHPESGGWHRDTFAERAGRPWFDPGGLFLAWERGRPVGACWTKLHPGGVGEIYSIAVRPSGMLFLDKIPDVTPLRTEGLHMLRPWQVDGHPVYQQVLALVYDSDISINYDPLNGNLQGATLGIIAFEVLAVGEPDDEVLPDVTIRIIDHTALCSEPLDLFLDAPAPISSSEPCP